MSDDIVVELAGGAYRLSAPLRLTAADSGNNGHHVVWRAAPSARPVLSGARAVTGWSVADAGRNIWRATVATGTDSRQLYVDGAVATRAQPRERAPRGARRSEAREGGHREPPRRGRFWSEREREPAEREELDPSERRRAAPPRLVRQPRHERQPFAPPRVVRGGDERGEDPATAVLGRRHRVARVEADALAAEDVEACRRRPVVPDEAAAAHRHERGRRGDARGTLEELPPERVRARLARVDRTEERGEVVEVGGRERPHVELRGGGRARAQENRSR
jgi:hypothetical protein